MKFSNLKEHEEGVILKETTDNTNKCSLAQIVLLLENPGTGERIKVNALHDTGATTKIISSKLLGKWTSLPTIKQNMIVNGCQGLRKSVKADIANINILSVDGKVKVNGDVTCVENPIGGNYSFIDWNQQKFGFSYLKDLEFDRAAEPLFGEMFPVLLGNDFVNLTQLDKDWIAKGNSPQRSSNLNMKNEPIALKLNVGWVALGYTDPNKENSRFIKEDNLEIHLQTFCYLRQESLIQEIFIANNYNSHDLMDSENMKLSARYKKINQLLMSNWKRFQEEYFPTLRKLNKWYTANYTFKKR